MKSCIIKFKTATKPQNCFKKYFNVEIEIANLILNRSKLGETGIFEQNLVETGVWA